MRKQTYLVVDTDIWLNNMAGFHDELFLIDRIETWVEIGEVILLIPDVIVEEWKRNSIKKARTIEEEWKQFYTRIYNAFGGIKTVGLLKPNEIEEWCAKYISRVEKLLKEAERIEIRDHHKIAAFELGLDKKAPFATKNSTADAVIFLSSVDFLRSNPEGRLFFLSNNKSDFSVSNNPDELHSDLMSFTQGLNFEFYRSIERFLANSGLPKVDIKSINSLKGNSWEQKVELPKYDLSGYEDFYIEDTKYIKDIIPITNPSKRHVKGLIDLISLNEKYSKYFFTNCENPVWFNILYKQNYFENDLNVKMETTKNFSPFWYPLLYFQKLVQDKSFEYTRELVSLLISCSSRINKNGKNIYEFIRTLKHLPNSFYDQHLVSAIDILVKGENPAFGLEDLAELVESNFFKDLSEDEVKISEDLLKIIVNVNDPHATFLERAILGKEGWLEQGAKVWSLNVVHDILNVLREHYYNFSHLSVKFKLDDKEIPVKFYIEGLNLVIDFPKFGLIKIENFEFLNRESFDNTLKRKIESVDSKLISTEENKRAYQTIGYNVYHGSFFQYNPDSLFDLKKENRLRTSTDVLQLFVARLLFEMTKTQPKQVWEIVSQIHCEPKFQLQGFKQIIVYLIGNNWKQGGYSFLKKNYNSIASVYLDQFQIKSDLADMLRQIASVIRKPEVKVIRSFVDSLVENSVEGVSDWSYLNWYSTLRKSPLLNQDYSSLSQKLGKDVDDFGGKGIRVHLTSGLISPIESVELVKMSIDEIMTYIKEFKPAEEFGGATYEGLAKTLGDTICESPNILVTHLDKFLDLPYLINYRLVWGLRDAWKNGKISDVSPVLNYFYDLLIAQGQENEKYKHLGDWGANPSWIISAVSDSILDFLKTDVRNISLNYLEKFKVIIDELGRCTEPTPKDKYKTAQNDAIMHALNSSGGKFVLAVMEYGLFYSKRKDNKRTMLPEVKQWFKYAKEKNIVECYGVFGAYCRSWNYLDSNWTTNLMTDFLELDDRLWLIFIDGLYSGNPTNEDELIPLVKLHFERAFNYGKISESVGIRSKGAVSYLVAWLFWGKDQLGDSEGINRKFFEVAKTDDLVNYLNFMWRQKKYYSDLNEKEKNKLRRIISSLWDYLLEKYPKNSENNPIYSVLKYLEQFFEELDEQLSRRMRFTLSGSESFLSDLHQMNAIQRFIENSRNNILTAKHLVNYLEVIEFVDSPFTKLFADMIEVIRFLYENDQHDFANKFCDYAASLENNYQYAELYQEFNRQKK